MGRGAPGMLIKRSFTLAGHRTSIALEAAFWQVLARIAARDGEAVSSLVAAIDRTRAMDTSLASALRLLALRQAVEMAQPENTTRDRAGD